MNCEIYPLNALNNYKYVVVLSIYNGRLMLSKHKNRTTWEAQGGHIEMGETPLEAAKRELYEESGAMKYKIVPAFDYRAGDNEKSNGMVFLAEIEEIGDLPDSEMKEVSFFEHLPEELTYPDITPTLLKKAAILS